MVGELYYWALDRFGEECSETGDINELSPLTSIGRRSKYFANGGNSIDDRMK